MPSQKRVLYCHCVHAGVLPPMVKEAVLRRLCESDLSFTAVADLCGLAGRKDPLLRELASKDSLQIAACYPRAVQWLFAAAQTPLRPGSVEVVNLRVETAEKAAATVTAPEVRPNLGESRTSETGLETHLAGEDSSATKSNLRLILYEGPGAAPLQAEARFEIVNALLEKGFAVQSLRNEIEISVPSNAPALVLAHFSPDAPKPSFLQGATIRVIEINGSGNEQVLEMVQAARTDLPQPAAWTPWFPVIDYDRCTQCMQCLSFCLFGVFGVDAQRKIAVQQSEQCKTNCPACSRVCPEAAIIFPKYLSGPINGEAINPAALEREKMKIDVSALLGGDVYEMLRERSERAHSRFSKERDSHKALQERQRCVAKLLQGANIPPEVLMALPSPEEIQRRAAEAMVKAKAALESKDTAV